MPTTSKIKYKKEIEWKTFDSTRQRKCWPTGSDDPFYVHSVCKLDNDGPLEDATFRNAKVLFKNGSESYIG